MPDSKSKNFSGNPESGIRNPDSLTKGDSLIHVFFYLTTICWFAVDLKEAMLTEANKSVSFIFRTLRMRRWALVVCEVC